MEIPITTLQQMLTNAATLGAMSAVKKLDPVKDDLKASEVRAWLVVPQGRNPTHFRCILQIPEVADNGQFRHPMLHLPLIVADSRKGAA